MPVVSIPWGDSELELQLPDHWKLQQVAKPILRSVGEDWPDRLTRAMENVESGLPLPQLLAARRSGRIVLVVEDMTRHSPLDRILPLILNEIEHSKISMSQVELVFATGMHIAMTDSQAAQKLGPLSSRLRWRSNNCRDEAFHEYIGQSGSLPVRIDAGVAGADLRIVVSSVSPHLQSGFGGGFKMLLPGCAHLETIRALHRLGIGRSDRSLVGTSPEENPMRLAIDHAGQLIDERHGKTFAVQYVLDESNQPAYIATGEMIATHRMLAKQCAVGCGILTNSQADVLIANAHPRDYDLWQSFKAIANTRWAVRPGGVIICLARCPWGVEGMPIPRFAPDSIWIRRALKLLGQEALASMITRLLPGMASDAAFFIRLAIRAIGRNHILMVSPNLAKAGVRFPGLDIFPELQQAVAVADKILKGQPVRVNLFSSAGICYPVLPAGAGEQVSKT